MNHQNKSIKIDEVTAYQTYSQIEKYPHQKAIEKLNTMSFYTKMNQYNKSIIIDVKLRISSFSKVS